MSLTLADQSLVPIDLELVIIGQLLVSLDVSHCVD